LETKTQARAPLRALVGAAAFGSLVGLAVGCAYLGGDLARTLTVRAKAERLVDAADAQFSEAALITAAGGLDESALQIARRHDPYTIAGAAQRDRQAAVFAARLERKADHQSRSAGLRQVSNGRPAPAVRPFVLDASVDGARDLECLTRAVYHEARGEGQSGMEAVAQVVLNRVRHPAFPKTVCGVVYQGAHKRVGCQFSFACDGSTDRRVEGWAWRRAERIASRALAGHVMSEIGTATHFHTTAVSPRWSGTLVRVAQVGDHVFYRFGGSAGSSRAFRGEVQPSTAFEVQPVIAGLAPAGVDEAVQFLTGGAADPAAAQRYVPLERATVAQKAAEMVASPAVTGAAAPAPVQPPAPVASEAVVPPAETALPTR
jgi:spore germination cell wall hydrolase CwlJ-like protein